MERAVWKSTPEAGHCPRPAVALPLLHPAGGWGSVPDGQGSGFAREAKVPGGSRQPSADGCCCRQT